MNRPGYGADAPRGAFRRKKLRSPRGAFAPVLQATLVHRSHENFVVMLLLLLLPPISPVVSVSEIGKFPNVRQYGFELSSEVGAKSAFRGPSTRTWCFPCMETRILNSIKPARESPKITEPKVNQNLRCRQVNEISVTQILRILLFQCPLRRCAFFLSAGALVAVLWAAVRNYGAPMNFGALFLDSKLCPHSGWCAIHTCTAS